MKIYSFSPFGYEGALVTVEVDLRRGIPAIDLVGLADGAVKEARERMQAAIRNSGFMFPPERVLISLSPADLKKEGAGFDLPIALGVLGASAEASNTANFLPDPVLVMGELELSGKVRAVKGVHAAVATAAACGIMQCIVPAQNADEAMEVTGVRVYGADTLENAFRALSDPSFFVNRNIGRGAADIPAGCEEKDGILFPKLQEGYEYGEITGQRELIRGLQIAAAGGHNLLAIGAPGCGKTMAIQKFPAINPVLTMEEAQSVTRIWSLAGLIKPNTPLVRIPPFRIPHQTASIEGICGGGPNCRPGEISLAHNGVLFLDEAAEFRSSVLQMLRVPLESETVTLSRAGRSTTYPARFQLLMAANPCPCGNYGSKTKICLCSGKSIDQYWKKFSAPLLDRIDLRVFVENQSESVKDQEAVEQRKDLVTTEEIREGIARAVTIQRKRQGTKNARLSPQEVQNFCPLEKDVRNVLDKAILRYGFSPRAISSCIKVARTIADIAGSEQITTPHITEAINFHKLCANMRLEL
ncbi:MAG: YifB family Mg chelatase-like AAA ATPase [Treponema sp.]|nr:YifB family Mg chelatase-like AAA ATPase [Treponema sp.]